ncbi:MAG: GNAT family N-acetyltransferase [Armatimonadetes bacterium]|nr:GNAT family N-acetyltransferase [Armatimonadota bacterium]
MSMEIRGLTEAELEAHSELVFRSYWVEGRSAQAVGDRLWWLRACRRDPYYRPEQSRVLFLDGRMVSSVTCFARPSYVAGRTVNAMCIGSVCTHPDYRGRGLARQTLAEAAEWMVSQGALWSFLYGLEAIYGGSGWRHLASWAVTADVRLPEDPGQGITARPADPDMDAPGLTAVHERFNRGLVGPTQRTEEFWRRRVLGAGSDSGYRVLERDGRAIGYYRAGDAAVGEMAWTETPEDVVAFLLRQWPGRPVSLPLATPEVLDALRAVAVLPARDDFRETPHSALTLHETSCGLWRYLQDPEGQFPEFHDTEGLIRFLRRHHYVMWPPDKA